MELGGNIEVSERMAAALERMAAAQERLNDLAGEQMSAEVDEFVPGPPVCPHCGTLNPTIRNDGGSGPWAEFALFAQCDNCGNTFIAEAQGWLTYRDKNEYEGREDVIGTASDS